MHACLSTFKMLFIKANGVKKPENSIDSLIPLVVLETPTCGALNEYSDPCVAHCAGLVWRQGYSILLT